MGTGTDRVEKRVTLKAPVARVWRALADTREFGSWFGVKLEGDFVVGKTITGTFEGDFNEAELMAFQKKLGVKPSGIKLPAKNESIVFCTVERMDNERHFSFRWIPYGIDVEADPKNEPTTLVEFHLERTADGQGTVLTIVESGFDKVPAHRRERAFRMNDHGWAAQAENLAKYVETH